MNDGNDNEERNPDTKKRKLKEEDIQLPKQRSNADSKRPCVEHESSSTAFASQDLPLSASPTSDSSHASQTMTRKINIPEDENNPVNTSETTSHVQPTHHSTNWFQAGHQPSLQQQQQQQLPQYTPGTHPPLQWQPSWTSTSIRGYDPSYSHQASSYAQNFSNQIPQYGRQNMYPSRNVASSFGRYQRTVYQVSNNEIVTPHEYWPQSSYPTRSLRHPSEYYQTVQERQEQSRLVYPQSGYLPSSGIAPLPQPRIASLLPYIAPLPQPCIAPLPTSIAPLPQPRIASLPPCIAPLPTCIAPSPQPCNASLPQPCIATSPQPCIAPLSQPRIAIATSPHPRIAPLTPCIAPLPQTCIAPLPQPCLTHSPQPRMATLPPSIVPLLQAQAPPQPEARTGANKRKVQKTANSKS